MSPYRVAALRPSRDPRAPNFWIDQVLPAVAGAAIALAINGIVVAVWYWVNVEWWR